MVEHENFVQILKSEYESSKRNNFRYSLRAFSKKINTSPSAVSEILNGKRRVTRKSMEQILSILGRNESISHKNKSKNINSNRKYKTLANKYWFLIHDWHYFAIQSLADTDDFKNCPNWIANRLNISTSRAQEALEVLFDLGLILHIGEEKYKSSNEYFFAESKTPSDIIKESHIQSLDLSKNSLFKTPLEFRDFSSITISLDPKDLPIAKEKIKRFRRSLNNFLERGNKKEVYKLNIQLFPLSTINNEIYKEQND